MRAHMRAKLRARNHLKAR